MKLRLLGAVCALLFSFSITSVSEAALVVPADLNAGDKYHVIFVTTTRTTGTSSDIAYYDGIVQADADAASIGTSIGLDGWKVVASTPTVDARDNISPLFSSLTDVPIYDQTGQRIANSYNDLWDNSILAPVQIDAYGDRVDYSTHQVVWTGTSGLGLGMNYSELGANLTGNSVFGSVLYADAWWMYIGSGPQSALHPLYALSPEITAVPVPAAAWLFGSGLLGLVGIAKQKKAA